MKRTVRASAWRAALFILLAALLTSCDKPMRESDARRAYDDGSHDVTAPPSDHTAIPDAADDESTDAPRPVPTTAETPVTVSRPAGTYANTVKSRQTTVDRNAQTESNIPAGERLDVKVSGGYNAPPPSPAKAGEAGRMALLREEGDAKVGVFGQAGVDQQALRMADSARAMGDVAFNTEEYDRIYENEFLESTKNPFSTFSIDVDRASYSNVRRYIQNGERPPRDAVRIEELVNYFSYDYPQPKDGNPFTISTEVADCPWTPGHKLVQIGLQGRRIPMGDIPASNLVFLIDVSGSMGEPNKLPLLKQAFRLLVNELRDRDRVSIVVYAGNAGLVLPPTRGSEKQTILAAIERLDAGGSTAGGEGIKLAYSTAEANFLASGNNRVILATDGDFNVGVSSDAELVRLIEDKRKSGVFLTVLGFGTGNYKDSKMEQLADKGNGNYAYIDNMNEAKKVFVQELGATLFTIAKDVKLQIEFNPAKVKAYRLIGYENRMLHTEDFNDDKKDAGELGAGHTVTALYEVVPAGAPVELASVDVPRYVQQGLTPMAYKSPELLTVKLRFKPPKDSVSKLLLMPLEDSSRSIAAASENLRFASSVAEWGLLLRDSQFKGSASIDHVLALATGAKGTDPFGYRTEFIDIVGKSRALLPVPLAAGTK